MRCGLPSTQTVFFCRLGLTVRLWTPTFLRPTPPRFLGEPLRMLVVVCRVLRPVIAHTLAMPDRLLQRHRSCQLRSPGSKLVEFSRNQPCSATFQPTADTITWPAADRAVHRPARAHAGAELPCGRARHC